MSSGQTADVGQTFETVTEKEGLRVEGWPATSGAAVTQVIRPS